MGGQIRRIYCTRDQWEVRQGEYIVHEAQEVLEALEWIKAE
jgi:hypothetical protein